MNIVQKGFSIVELMITISIMALLMALVAPSMHEWVVNIRLRNTAEITMVGLQKARAEAIKQNKTITFWLVSPKTDESLGSTCALASDSASWVISVNNPEGKCNVGIPTPLVDPFIVELRGGGKAAEGVTVSSKTAANADANQVSFDGFGQIANGANAARSIDFTSDVAGTRRIRVQVAAAGSVRMCDRDVVAPDPRVCT